MVNVLLRRALLAALTLALATTALARSTTAFAQTPGPASAPVAPSTNAPVPGSTSTPKPECERTVVAMAADVDSARVRAGDPFTFRTADAATAPDGSAIPAGTLGYGTVQIAQHAQRGGRGGYLVLDARFLALANGAHVPVTLDPVRSTNATATGGSGNIPGLVNAVPLVGYVTGPYAFIHHGHDVTIPRGARLAVIVGDDAALGTCRIPAANETPAPSPSPAPSP